MMLKLSLMSIVFAPVAFGIWIALSRLGRRGYPLLVGVPFAYGVFCIVLLWLVRHRWVQSSVDSGCIRERGQQGHIRSLVSD